MLLENFDILKDNYDKNCEAFSKAIGQMSKLDKGLAKDMWTYLLEKYINVLHNTNVFGFFTPACYITEYVTTAINENIGERSVVKMIINNPRIMECLFAESSCISFNVASTTYGCPNIIASAIVLNELMAADKMYGYVENNKYNALTTNKQVLENIISDLKHTKFEAKDTYGLISSWIDRLPDREDIAALKVDLYNLVEGL